MGQGVSGGGMAFAIEGVGSLAGSSAWSLTEVADLVGSSLVSGVAFADAQNGGGGERDSETVTNNQGKEIDVTPSKNHTTSNKNPGYKGEPNSSVDILDKDGNVVTRRWFDENGKAIRDVDMTNHGNPKQHPEWPHEHFWEYGPDGKPIGR